MTGPLRVLSCLRDALRQHGTRPRASALTSLDRARREGARDMAAAIAAQIRSTAPRPHGTCAGVPRCAVCAAGRQAERLAALAEATGTLA